MKKRRSKEHLEKEHDLLGSVEEAWKNPEAARAFLKQEEEKDKTLDQVIGRRNAIEWMFARRLSDRDFQDYVRIREVAEQHRIGKWIDPHDHTRLSEVMKMHGLSIDPEKVQFHTYDLLVVQNIMEDHVRDVERRFLLRIESILESKKSAEAKLTSLKRYTKFVRERDPQREKLFLYATEIYAEDNSAVKNPRLKLGWIGALKEANRRKTIYSEEGFDLSFNDIEAHFRKWRSRNKDRVSKILKRVAETRKKI